jgi:hypothetical protein
MTPDQFRDWVIVGLTVLVLIAFVWLFAPELWRELMTPTRTFSQQIAAQQVTDPRTYVTTAVAALVGGVVAIFLGVEGAKADLANTWEWVDYIRVVYVVVYVLFGSAAIVAWVRNSDGTSLSVKNLAVTFIGLVTPAVAAYLGAPQLSPR